MILRIVHAAILPGKMEAFKKFINTSLAPGVRGFPGCQFLYVADCVQHGHENEVIFVSGWDKMETCDKLEKTDLYPGEVVKVKNFYTDRFNETGALHIHYDTFADFP
ncbi:MAG: hypothetical protein EPN41_12745 [Candidimonas sp.]|nr:MAG: hypothetical protein EPN41_12745 [Candidimonas sp.]